MADVSSMDGAAAERTERLKRLAAETGAAWVGSWCERLRRERRRIAGGWPGTIPEARARLLARLDAEGRREWQVTADELEALTRAAYVEAKSAWRSVAAADEEH